MDTRFCKKCERTLPLDAFHVHRTRSPGYTCKECARAATQALLKPRQDAIRAIKLEKGCERCGYREHFAALDFDHGPGIKNAGTAISDLLTKTSVPMEQLVALASECSVLCANCHRIVSYERKQLQRPHRSAIAEAEAVRPRVPVRVEPGTLGRR